MDDRIMLVAAPIPYIHDEYIDTLAMTRKAAGTSPTGPVMPEFRLMTGAGDGLLAITDEIL